MSQPEPEKTLAALGIGGNVGDVLANMGNALRALDARCDTKVVSLSNIYKTPPWGVEDQDWFLNACVTVTTSLMAHELLDLCLEIERSMKRERSQRWGPRTIDLDILTYGEDTIQSDKLNIPHPRMIERQFVLQPLSDILPALNINGETAAHWIKQADWKPLEQLELDKDWWKA